MKRMTAILRVSLSLTLLCLSVLVGACILGAFPDRRPSIIEGRVALCEALAIDCSSLVRLNKLDAVQNNLQIVLERNPQLLSAGLRRQDHQLVAAAGDHGRSWVEAHARGDDGCFLVPILSGKSTWGHLELRFTSLYGGWRKHINPDFVHYLLVVTPLCAVMFTLQLRRVLRHLNPSRVVPDRVRAAFDTLAEGVVLLDRDERIVLANRAFVSHAGQTADELLGQQLARLPWRRRGDETTAEFPWQQASKQQGTHLGGLLALERDADRERVFKVNSVAIVDESGKYRGALASFDDITELEQKKAELLKMLEALRLSRDEVHKQNQELQYLATRDPLTGCLNRRSFFEQFEFHWKSAARYKHPLSCLVVDLDHFKSINDTYGHAAGDEVLRKAGATLLEQARDSDVVCRYGGEEFCVLLPHLDIENAAKAAERLREALGQMRFAQLRVSASIGVSSLSLGAKEPQELLDQADKSLYVAKRNGRNRVARWDQVSQHEIDDSQTLRTQAEVQDERAAIPYHAVTALMSALAFRDAETAAHSTRVADLAVLLARGRMSARDAYIVEIAALLHDIGKVGVPDAILLKPGRLTAEEWDVMAMHDRFGVEIINSCFQCQPLTEIVRNHHALYGGDPSKPHLPSGENIPLGARIVSICDAYDAMVSDRPYRKGCSMDQAFAELRRCAGRQFDPALVEDFISAVQACHSQRTKDSSQLSQETALGIGQQIERIVGALDARDIEGMGSLAKRLEATARHYQAIEIAEAAHEIMQLAAGEAELTTLLKATHELLDLCRSTHSGVIERAKRCPSAD